MFIADKYSTGIKLQTFPRICRGLSERCLEAFGYTENTVRLEGYITRTAHKTSQHFSNKFKAVLNHVSKLPYMDSKIKELVEVELEDDQRISFVGQVISSKAMFGVKL